MSLHRSRLLYKFLLTMVQKSIFDEFKFTLFLSNSVMNLDWHWNNHKLHFWKCSFSIKSTIQAPFIQLRLINWILFDYRIYSSERSGSSFNFGFSREGAYFKKTSKYFQLVILNQTIRTVIITEEWSVLFLK